MLINFLFLLTTLLTYGSADLDDGKHIRFKRNITRKKTNVEFFKPFGLKVSIVKLGEVQNAEQDIESLDVGQRSPEASECAKLCDKSRAANVEHSGPEDSDLEEIFNGSPKFRGDQFNIQNLNTYCQRQDVMTYKECLDQCPPSNFKNALLKGYEPLNYMCTNSAYLEQINCLHVAYLNSKFCFNIAHCSQKEDALDEHVSHSDIALAENFTKPAERLCDYYQCFFTCARQRITNSCSSEAFEAFKKLAQTRVSSIREIYAALNQSYTEPTQCTTFCG